MDTKSLIIENAKILFQQKGYNGVGLNEILKISKVTKGSLYHHFPNGKEELLIACLQSMSDTITSNIERIFNQYETIQEASQAMIDMIIADFERDGTITGYTITSIVSEMGSLSESVRQTCTNLYAKIQSICFKKLIAEGFSTEKANSISLVLLAIFEGAIILCLTKKTSEPLKMISDELTNVLKGYK
ncbi:TetR/AcrR family transcriptional regulator [Bacillus sp. B15-48]|uniref:TetR/AcrR family transcriptional regulator n=1 Tax=Bacillus sp. B15-48 TaxID=1548601 RepID=UPI00193F6939|nr:TetR/AcrR family transcriptional regulator [Bacillus sp. B15-48]MBM4762925.1 TetR family transcriptional regulator [Bacillus sp. B15-48]